MPTFCILLTYYHTKEAHLLQHYQVVAKVASIQIVVHSFYISFYFFMYIENFP